MRTPGRSYQEARWDITIRSIVITIRRTKNGRRNTIPNRETTHGIWDEQSQLSFDLKTSVRDYLLNNGRELPADISEAVDMILFKVSRMVTGDFSEADHFADSAGYSLLPILKRHPEIVKEFCEEWGDLAEDRLSPE